MNPEKVGQIIKDLRVKDNLTQAKFADKYGVTYQAVSKWENGKSIPDLSVLTKICNDYNLNLDDILDNKVSNKNNNNNKHKYILFLIIIILLVVSIFVFLFINKKSDFEFKTLSSTCNNFQLYGSVAYNKEKMSIYISNITYCGEENNDKYKKIECVLYENHDDTKIKVSEYNYEDKLITLEEFLQQVNFKVDDYDKACNKENDLHLEIDATNKDGKVTSYKIPLKLEDNCLN